MKIRNFVRGNTDFSLWIVVYENSTIRATYQWIWINVLCTKFTWPCNMSSEKKNSYILKLWENIIKLPRRDGKHQPLYTVNSRCQFSHGARNLMTVYMTTFCQVMAIANLVRGKCLSLGQWWNAYYQRKDKNLKNKKS